MTKTWIVTATMITVLSSVVARADAFDEKASASEARKERAEGIKAQAAALKERIQNNTWMVRRVPKGASIIQCFDTDAFRYRNRENGCRLANTEWKGIPIQVCTESFFGGYTSPDGLPPEIVACHYHVHATGRDCEMVRNTDIKPECY